jgi:cytochrome P450
MLHDPAQYPNPEIFDPTRFLNKDGKLDLTMGPNPLDASFGFGRRFVSPSSLRQQHDTDSSKNRVCAGRPIALSLSALAASSMLSIFSINRRVDPDTGKERDPREEVHWYDSAVMYVLSSGCFHFLQ